MEKDRNQHCINHGPKDGVENRPYDGNRNSRRNDDAVIVRRRVRERFRQNHGKVTTNHNGEARSSYQSNPSHKHINTKVNSLKNERSRLCYYRHRHRLAMLELKIDALRRRSSTIGRRRIHDHHQATSHIAASRIMSSSSSSKDVSDSPLHVSSLRTLPSNREIGPVSDERGTSTTSPHSKNSDENASLPGNGDDVDEHKNSDSMRPVSRHMALPSHEKISDVLPKQNGDYINVDALAIANARRSIEEARLFLAARKLMKHSTKDEALNTENPAIELDCVPKPVDQSENHQSQDSDYRDMRATSFPFVHSEEDHSNNEDFVQFEHSFPLDEPHVATSQSGELKTESTNGNKDNTVVDDSCKGHESSPSITETRNALADVTLNDEYKGNHYYGINKLFSCSSSRNRSSHQHKTLDKQDLTRNGSSTHSSSRGNTAEGSDQLTNSTSQDASSDYGRAYRKIKSNDTQRKSITSAATKWYIRQNEDGQEVPEPKPAVRRSSFFGRKSISRATATTAQNPTESGGVIMDMVFFDVVHPHNSDLDVVPEDQSLFEGQESFGLHEE